MGRTNKDKNKVSVISSSRLARKVTAPDRSFGADGWGHDKTCSSNVRNRHLRILLYQGDLQQDIWLDTAKFPCKNSWEFRSLRAVYHRGQFWLTTGRSASKLSMERVGQIKKALNMANWFPLIGICDQPKNSYMTACAVSPVRVLCYIPRRDGVRDEMEVVGSLSTPNYREPILALLYPQNPGSGHG